MDRPSRKPARILWVLAGAFVFLHPRWAGAQDDELSALIAENIALQDAGRLEEALPVHTRIATLIEAQEGPTSRRLARVLGGLGGLYRELARYDEAVEPYRRSLVIFESLPDAEPGEIVRACSDLAYVLKKQARYAQARPLYERALSLARDGSADAATIRNNLADLLMEQGEFAAAAPLFEEALAATERAVGRSHPESAIVLSNLARAHYRQGRTATAQPLYEDALARFESALGPDHPHVALSLNNLAELHRHEGRHREAGPLYERALAILEARVDPGHPWMALLSNNVGLLESSRGNYPAARHLLERSIAIREAIYGPDHPLVGNALANLGHVDRLLGDFVSAERRLARALAVLEAAHGPGHIALENPLRGLAQVYSWTGRVDRALEAQRRVVALWQAAADADGADLAAAFTQLGEIEAVADDLDSAEAHLRRALEILESRDKAHADLALPLAGLAHIRFRQGEAAQADRLYARALAAAEATLSKNDPTLARYLDGRAFVAHERELPRDALALLGRAGAILDHVFARIVHSGSEAQRLAYATDGIRHMDLLLTVALAADGQARGAAARAAANEILRRKGRVLDALAADRARLRRSTAAADRELFAEWQDLIRREADAARSSASAFRPLIQASLAGIRADLEARTGAVAPAPTVTLASVAGALPRGARLLEYVVYERLERDSDRPTRFVARQRYAGCVLGAQIEPRCVDLESAAAVDEAVSALRAALVRTEDSSWEPAAAALAALVLAPLDSGLATRRHLFVAPDGALHLVPFAVLSAGDGRPLVERTIVTQLGTGRELVETSPRAGPSSPALVVAAPDYDAGNGERPGKRFVPLAFAKDEGEILTPLLGARLLTGEAADEASLKAIRGPRILHVATHGFFAGGKPLRAGGRGVALIPLGDDTPPPRPNADGHPLLRAGIALAGANRAKSYREQFLAGLAPGTGRVAEDGVLTALEVSALDLGGTELVVLSACETGLGDVEYAEGLFGLRRALVLAGARTQVLSLWSVADASTRDLMVSFYRALRAGEGRAAALRAAQLDLRRRARYAHPFFWAPFVVSGDWRDIQWPD